ncbi:transposase [Propionivibrio limicola]|uniref:transposase n=1 Tax=Propionivibrio limicola TaxID=167645 RepID=UPI001290A69A|nr:transposase [Propionivibrio limicola]
MPSRKREVPTLAELHARRKVAVRLHLQDVPMMRIVAATGLSRPGVRAALTLFAEGGMAALKPTERGRKPGSGRRLSEAQEARIQHLLCRQRPEQVGLDGALWDRQAVAQLIRRESGRQPILRSTGKYLARWGLLPPQAQSNDTDSRPGWLQRWLEVSYPSVRLRAVGEGAQILWARRSTHLDPAPGRPEDQPRLTMLSATSNRRKSRWMLFPGLVSEDRLIEFMTALINDATRKIVLIVDRFDAFQHQGVQSWLHEHAGRLELVFFPEERSTALFGAYATARANPCSTTTLASAASGPAHVRTVRRHREGTGL